jgi:hypothetical protein
MRIRTAHKRLRGTTTVPDRNRPNREDALVKYAEILRIVDVSQLMFIA